MQQNEQSSSNQTNSNLSRSFSRPYSAKTVYFYKEGDVYFTGVRVPVSKHRYKTFDSLLEDLNHQIYMPFGVRNITTPKGNSTISELDQLEHLGKYVASSSKPPRGLDFEEVEKLRLKMSAAFRTQRPGGQAFWVPASASSTQKIRMGRMLGFNIISAKQVLFVLNGKGKYFRMVINPNKIIPMDQLLEEISAGLQAAIFRLFSNDGHRISTVEEILSINSPMVIACPRNERPFFEKKIALPEIKPSHYAPRMHYNMKQSVGSSSLTSGSSSSVSNGVDKMPKIDNPRLYTKKSTVLAAQNRKNRLRKQLNLEPKKTEAIWTPSRKLGPIEKSKLSKIRQPIVVNRLRQHGSTQNSSSAETSENTSGTSGSMRNGGTSERINTTTSTGKADDLRTGESSFILEEDGEDGIGLSDSSEYDIDRKRESLVVEEDEEGEEKNKEETVEKDEESLALQTPDSTRPSTHQSHQSRQSTTETSRNLMVEEKEEEELGTPAIQTPETTRLATPKTPKTPTPRTPRVASSLDQEVTEVPNEGGEDKEAAAVRIQAAFRGHLTRNQMKVKFGTIVRVPTLENENENENDNGGENGEARKISGDESESQKSNNPESMTYTIELYIGSRFSADTEADVYMTIHGDDSTSDRIHIQNVEDWMTTEQPQFVPGSLIRSHVTTKYLGTITKIVVGHEREGYGAGMFLEKVIIVENTMDGRKFLFFVDKWFDSGQVDGKMQRTVYLSTFLYLIARPIRKNAVTLGRWEFIIHSRKDEEGGTTSNLTIVGYGNGELVMNLVENDSMLRGTTTNPLIQVDFGEGIGQLEKVRFEIDGAGDRPNYFIEYVECRDLDTDERSAVSVNNWLITKPDETMKKYQPFREITIYRAAQDPLPMITYEGKVTLADTSLFTGEIPEMKLQLLDKYSLVASGAFPVIPTKSTTGKPMYTFKIDMVKINGIHEIRVIPSITDLGKDILAGLDMLNNTYAKIENRNHVDRLWVAQDLFVSEISIRETAHTPFRYIFGHSNINEEENNDDGPFFKSLCFKTMEGLSTKKKPSKEEAKSPQTEFHYMLFMCPLEPKNFQAPFAILCSKNGVTQQMGLATNIPDTDLFVMELHTTEIDLVDKIRIGVDEVEHGKSTLVQKMRLIESFSRTESRMTLKYEFRDFEIIEVSCTYPDVSPKISAFYSVFFKTYQSKGIFRPWVNIIGTEGDTGFRAYPELQKFENDTEIQLNLESHNLGNFKRIQIKCTSEQKTMSWKFSIELAQRYETTVRDAEEEHEKDVSFGAPYATSELTIKKADTIIETELVALDSVDIPPMEDGEFEAPNKSVSVTESGNVVESAEIRQGDGEEDEQTSSL